MSSPNVVVFMMVPPFLKWSQHLHSGTLMPSGSGGTHISELTPAAASDFREERAAFIPSIHSFGLLAGPELSH